MALEASTSGDGIQRAALDHLWLHFTDMGGYADPADLQVMVRGDGCYLEDSAGRRYLDALAGLFCVNIGYGFGEEMGEAAAGRCASSPSRSTGRSRTRALSSWPRSWLRWRPVIWGTPSSCRAARRRSRPPGSSPASTTPPGASAAGR